MKKNKLLFFAPFLWALNSNAQLSLTKAANEPVAGDRQVTQEFDSTTVLPRNTGQNQTWNFSTLMKTQSAAETTSFVAASSVPSASLFPGATLASMQMTNDVTFFKSSVSQYENMGYNDVGAIMNYSNTQSFVWPLAYGNTQIDVYSGQGTGTSTDSRDGSITTTASGTGTLMLPGNQSFVNVLQVKTTITDTQSSPGSTLIITGTNYDYYAAGQKFPLLSVAYITLTSGTLSADFAGISMNGAVVVGIKEQTKLNLFTIFPNPAKENVTLTISNPDNKNCSVTISNSVGQVMKTLDLGNDRSINEKIDLSELASGIYFIKTKSGTSVEVKKIVVE